MIIDWGDNLRKWQDFTNDIESILIDVITSDSSFKKYFTYFRSLPELDGVLDVISTNPDSLNVLIFISKSNVLAIEKYILNQKVCKVLVKNESLLTEFSKRQLLSVYLENLFLVQTSESNQQLLSIIKNVLRSQQIEEKYVKTGLLNSKPIKKFVEYSISQKKEPKDIILDESLSIGLSSDTFRRIEHEYVLELIKNVDLRAKSQLPKKILQSDYFNVPIEDELLLGHKIIMAILNDREEVNIHSYWIELILKVASDPRTVKTSPKYIMWWQKLDKIYIERFIKILSHQDILLFLDAISEYARETNNIAMKRMYKSRKQLLSGLSLQGVITESRLFLPRQMKIYLNKKRPDLDLSFVADLRGGGDKCLIYLKVAGLYIIEGSHNFAFRIFRHIPRATNLMKAEIGSFHIDAFSSKIASYQVRNGYPRPISYTHDPHSRWKVRVIRVISNEVKLDTNMLYTDEEIRFGRR